MAAPTIERYRDASDWLSELLGAPVTIDEANSSLAAGERRYPIENGVIRFRRDDGYNASFAMQWKAFRLTQYDHVNGTTLTRNRYERGTGWPLVGLDGETILEAGCGAGRFTRYLGATGARLVSIDYSAAVDVSAEMNGDHDNILFAQADILDPPFAPASFDRVFCHGVIQHTPDPARAFQCLDRLVKPGGYLSIDVYLKDGRIRPWKSKYLWRPLTRTMDPARLMTFLRWFIPKWLPIDTCIKRLPVLGNYLGAVIPCWNYFYTGLPQELKVEWAIMDTFDALAPAHDNPVTLAEVEGWFRRASYADFTVTEGGNGVLGNGRKPR